MSTPMLFDAEPTIASPWCIYTKCPRKGRAVIGPERRVGDSINREIRCLTCGCFGDQSKAAERRDHDAV